MTGPDPAEPTAPRAPRRRLRAACVALLALAAVHLGAWRAGLTKVTTPGDVLLTLGPVRREPALVPPPGPRRLVVVLHGVGRSAWSMWKAERALEAHGYEVWNETYDGRETAIAELAADLGRRLDDHLARRGEPGELYAVAHSMGGLVLRAYLARDGARRFTACVCLGTPQRGAVLARELRDTWSFGFFLGHAAARDLAPDSAFMAALGPAPVPVGNVIGALRGAGSARIPGLDDGRVAIDEAHLDGEADAIVLLGVGHTLLPGDPRALHQVLFFLRHGRFDRGTRPR